MNPDLSTTNTMLGIMAAVSVLEALLIVGTGIAIVILYRRVTWLLKDVDARHLTPLSEKASAILDDLKDVTARINDDAQRVDRRLHATVDRVDRSAERVRSNVRYAATRIVDVVSGIRAALHELFA
jgi:hypothetical protein